MSVPVCHNTFVELDGVRYPVRSLRINRPVGGTHDLIAAANDVEFTMVDLLRESNGVVVAVAALDTSREIIHRILYGHGLTPFDVVTVPDTARPQYNVVEGRSGWSLVPGELTSRPRVDASNAIATAASSLTSITIATPQDFQLFSARGGRTHLVVGGESKRAFCGKVEVESRRLVYRPARMIDCRYCVNFLKGRTKGLVLDAFPAELWEARGLKYARDYYDMIGERSRSRLCQVAIDLFYPQSPF